ncbi:MAG TPA: SRPBCC domain-containing protein [Gemmatimonadales bacterium]|nr:SRPBCC domain-containing protein [Gemmatimonadales bacterium]HET9209282.1 SRPBCC domain-containing protein [Thermoanaerobaculia bacterium]
MPKQSERMRDEAVRAKTGKSWDEWFAILDAAGARSMGHKEIVTLAGGHGIGPWWRQMVTVTYEQARGMREKHQTVTGYTANASRTIGAPVDRLFEAWSDAALRGRWLPDAELTIRKATPGKSLRISWGDGSNVDVGLIPKGDSKSQIAVEHAKLPDAEAVARAKGYWKQALDRLQAMVEG